MTGDRIKITAGGVTVVAELNESDTARALWDALPITARANTWGDEIYFGIGVEEDLDEDAQETVAPGTLGYWPTGDALCLFFGPTPISTDDEIRPASAVNIVGIIEGDPTVLKKVPGGSAVTVERG